MKPQTLLAALLSVCSGVAVGQSSDYPVRPVPLTAVRVDDSFWTPRFETNRLRTVWYDFQKCEETGRIDNFAKAGRLMPSEFRGTPFDDSDVFKVIEGAAYTLALHPDAKLDQYLDELIRKIGAAQEPDGYLYSARTIDPKCRLDFFGPTRWSKLEVSHELYNVRHLYEAAVAHAAATGKRTLLEIALKNADLVCKTFGPGPGQIQEPPGHEEIEIGLVKLFRATGGRKYLEQAKYFCELRGRAETHKLRGSYQQDHAPIRQQAEAVGHSVRAGYFYSGVADVAALTGDATLVQAIDGLWSNVVGKKLHLTGGIGAKPGGEAFGLNYELPNESAYLETCAAIANALWNHRMFLLHGDAQYVDVLERVIYNGFLSGIGLTGDRFLYPNPLEWDGKSKFNVGCGERAPWFGCSCCPVNDVRFIPEIASFIYATRGEDLFVNLFIGGTAEVELDVTRVEVKQETRYPWSGTVKLKLQPEQPKTFALHVRIPGWARNQPVPGDLYRYDDGLAPKVKLAVNGKVTAYETVQGFAICRRQWSAGDTVTVDFEMPVRRVVAHPNVKADRDRFAIERGPLVYCAEGADNDGSVLAKYLPGKVTFKTVERPDLLGGVVTVNVAATKNRTRLLAIPYYAWCHRGPNEMRVWHPVTDQVKLASHCSFDSVEAAYDGIEPKSSHDHDIPRFTWWDHRGTSEWIIQPLGKPRKISAMAVYWFDDTGRGSCRVPQSWRLLHREGKEWKPVKDPTNFGTALDQYNRVSFAPVTTTELKIEAQLQPDFSAGILEWQALP